MKLCKIVFHRIRNYLEQANLRIYMLCFVDRGVLLGGGESDILWSKFFFCFANSQLLVVCMQFANMLHRIILILKLL